MSRHPYHCYGHCPCLITPLCPGAGTSFSTQGCQVAPAPELPQCPKPPPRWAGPPCAGLGCLLFIISIYQTQPAGFTHLQEGSEKEALGGGLPASLPRPRDQATAPQLLAQVQSLSWLGVLGIQVLTPVRLTKQQGSKRRGGHRKPLTSAQKGWHWALARDPWQ